MQSGNQGLNLIQLLLFFHQVIEKGMQLHIGLDHNDKLTFSVTLNAAFSLKVSKA